MKAESTIKPVNQFEIEDKGNGYVDIRFFQNITTKQKKQEDDDKNIIYQYEEYLLENIRKREGLQKQIENNYQIWLDKAIKKENEPKPETDKEKILRLEKENNTLGIELSEREIEGMVQGMQISDLEIQILQLQSQGGSK